MRKAFIAVALAALVLAGCASASRPYTVADADTLMDAGIFSGDMAKVTSPAMAARYGVDAGDILDFVSYQSTNTAVSCDEVTVLVLKDQDAAVKAEDACRERIADELENARSYTSAAVPSLEAAIVERVDNTVLLLVADPAKAAKAVEDLSGKGPRAFAR